jgi:NDP-sugar pyrophosphorylase family protein
MMQVVILTGGLATRLRPLTSSLPKAMIPIRGKPFVEYQIGLLKHYNIKDIVLCVGHLREKIRDYLGDGEELGVKIKYSEEEENRLLGTAGALRNAEPLLEDQFLLLNGDSYLLVDYVQVLNRLAASGQLGLMVVYENHNRFDRSNVAISNGFVSVYDRRNQTPDMTYIDYGLSALRKKALELIPEGRFAQLDDLYQELTRRKELIAFETQRRFYEIGSHRGLREFRKLMKGGGF